MQPHLVQHPHTGLHPSTSTRIVLTTPRLAVLAHARADNTSPALKEWTVACSALASGDQTVLALSKLQAGIRRCGTAA